MSRPAGRNVDPLIGELVRLRKAAGMRQDDLAAVSGVGRTTIINIEAGRSSPTLAVLRRLADALKADLHAVGRPWEEVSFLHSSDPDRRA